MQGAWVAFFEVVQPAAEGVAGQRGSAGRFGVHVHADAEVVRGTGGGAVMSLFAIMTLVLLPVTRSRCRCPRRDRVLGDGHVRGGEQQHRRAAQWSPPKPLPVMVLPVKRAARVAPADLHARSAHSRLVPARQADRSCSQNVHRRRPRWRPARCAGSRPTSCRDRHGPGGPRWHRPGCPLPGHPLCRVMSCTITLVTLPPASRKRIPVRSRT